MLHGHAIAKGSERYIVLYDSKYRSIALATIGRWAGNPDLSFDWYDAACVSEQVRKGLEAEKLEKCGGRY